MAVPVAEEETTVTMSKRVEKLSFFSAATNTARSSSPTPEEREQLLLSESPKV